MLPEYEIWIKILIKLIYLLPKSPFFLEYLILLINFAPQNTSIYRFYFEYEKKSPSESTC